MTLKDLAEIFPERFSNKTNRRHAPALANGQFPAGPRDYRGHRRWLDHRPRPAPETRTAGSVTKGFQGAFLQAKRDAKNQFANWLKTTSGQVVDPDTIFDCQIKRIHEYRATIAQ